MVVWPHHDLDVARFPRHLMMRLESSEYLANPVNFGWQGVRRLVPRKDRVRWWMPLFGSVAVDLDSFQTIAVTDDQLGCDHVGDIRRKIVFVAHPPKRPARADYVEQMVTFGRRQLRDEKLRRPRTVAHVEPKHGPVAENFCARRVGSDDHGPGIVFDENGDWLVRPCMSVRITNTLQITYLGAARHYQQDEREKRTLRHLGMLDATAYRDETASRSHQGDDVGPTTQRGFLGALTLFA